MTGPIAIFAATLMVFCQVSSLRLSTSGNPAMDLQDDEVFNKKFDEQRDVTTVLDSPHNFNGNNIEWWRELPEHFMARTWIPVNATVIEFGARFGTTTCEIAKKLGNSGRLVAVEPDANVHDALQGNLELNNCNAHVLRGVVASAPLYIPQSHGNGKNGTGYGTQAQSHGTGKTDVKVPNFSFEDIEHVLGMVVDTMLLDCEGCIQNIMDVLRPKIQRDIKLLLLEADKDKSMADNDKSMDYEPFKQFMTESGFDIVDSFNGCDRDHYYSPQPGAMGPPLPCTNLWHYAFLRRSKE